MIEEDILTIDLSNLKLESIPDHVFENKNLKHIKLSPGNNIEVSEKYRLIDTLGQLETLDGKDLTIQRSAIQNLNAIFRRRLQEMFLTKAASDIYCENVEEQERIKMMVELAQKTVFAGPSALNLYRNFKLEQLIKDNYEFFVSDALELKLEKEERETTVSGTPRKKARYLKEVANLKASKKKRNSSPFVNRKPRKASSSHSLQHLLQTHSKQNDPDDFQTKVWMCAFEPDINKPGQTTNLVATCGGDSICFIDCETGLVLKKYKQANEEFYCLAWTILKYRNELSKEETTLAALAVAGRSGDIKLIDPENLVCFEHVSYHKKPVDALVFHPIIQHWLFSGSEDRTVILWDLGYPFSTDVRHAEKKLVLKGSLKSTVRNLTITLNGKVILGACDDGLYAWNIDFVGATQEHVRPSIYCFKLPSKKSQAVDSLNILSNNLFAMKRLSEGTIKIIHSKSQFLEDDLQLVTSLNWRETDTPFLKFSFSAGCGMLVAGDDEGTVWMYDLNKLLTKSKEDGEAEDLRKSVEIIEPKKLRCENKYGRLLNHVCCSSPPGHVVGASDTNVVCLWREKVLT